MKIVCGFLKHLGLFSQCKEG